MTNERFEEISKMIRNKCYLSDSNLVKELFKEVNRLRPIEEATKEYFGNIYVQFLETNKLPDDCSVTLCKLFETMKASQ